MTTKRTRPPATSIYLQGEIVAELDAYTRELRMASGGDPISQSEVARRAIRAGIKALKGDEK